MSSPTAKLAARRADTLTTSANPGNPPSPALSSVSRIAKLLTTERKRSNTAPELTFERVDKTPPPESKKVSDVATAAPGSPRRNPNSPRNQMNRTIRIPILSAESLAFAASLTSYLQKEGPKIKKEEVLPEDLLTHFTTKAASLSPDLSLFRTPMLNLFEASPDTTQIKRLWQIGEAVLGLRTLSRGENVKKAEQNQWRLDVLEQAYYKQASCEDLFTLCDRLLRIDETLQQSVFALLLKLASYSWTSSADYTALYTKALALYGMIQKNSSPRNVTANPSALVKNFLLMLETTHTQLKRVSHHVKEEEALQLIQFLSSSENDSISHHHLTSADQKMIDSMLDIFLSSSISEITKLQLCFAAARLTRPILEGEDRLRTSIANKIAQCAVPLSPRAESNETPTKELARFLQLVHDKVVDKDFRLSKIHEIVSDVLIELLRHPSIGFHHKKSIAFGVSKEITGVNHYQLSLEKKVLIYELLLDALIAEQEFENEKFKQRCLHLNSKVVLATICDSYKLIVGTEINQQMGMNWETVFAKAPDAMKTPTIQEKLKQIYISSIDGELSIPYQTIQMKIALYNTLYPLGIAILAMTNNDQAFKQVMEEKIAPLATVAKQRMEEALDFQLGLLFPSK